MARRVFFSFHYQRDIWRVNQIRSIPNVTGCSAAGFQDASIWEDAKKKGDDAIKKLIRDGLKTHPSRSSAWGKRPLAGNTSTTKSTSR